MTGVIIFTLLAFILGVMLVVVHRLLNRKELLTERISELLPGYNCGACGFAGCLGMAENMIENLDNLKKCKPIKQEQYDSLMEFMKKRK